MNTEGEENHPGIQRTNSRQQTGNRCKASNSVYARAHTRTHTHTRPKGKQEQVNTERRVRPASVGHAGSPALGLRGRGGGTQCFTLGDPVQRACHIRVREAGRPWHTPVWTLDSGPKNSNHEDCQVRPYKQFNTSENFQIANVFKRPTCAALGLGPLSV